MRRGVDAYDVSGGGRCAIWREDDGRFSWEVTYAHLPDQEPVTDGQSYDSIEAAMDAAPKRISRPVTFDRS